MSSFSLAVWLCHEGLVASDCICTRTRTHTDTMSSFIVRLTSKWRVLVLLQLAWIYSYVLLNAACKLLHDLRCHTTSLLQPRVKYQAAEAPLCVFQNLSKRGFYWKIPSKYAPVNITFSSDKSMKEITCSELQACISNTQLNNFQGRVQNTNFITDNHKGLAWEWEIT